jgi:hypothetical protein
MILFLFLEKKVMSLQAITIENMPSTVTQLVPHESRSAKYSHVATKDIVSWLGDNDFVPVYAANSKTRKPEREGFQKHLLRFRRSDSLDTVKVKGDAVSEILLRNSHDGTSGIQLWSGIFRMVCANGLIVADKSFEKISIPHRGNNIADKVIDAAYRVIDVSNKALTGVQEWQKIELSKSKQTEFAERALSLRFEKAEDSPITPVQLLSVRRYSDVGTDLWSVFNRVQENLVRGGICGLNKKDEHGSSQWRTLRKIRGADRNIELNRDLWGIASEYAH